MEPTIIDGFQSMQIRSEQPCPGQRLITKSWPITPSNPRQIDGPLPLIFNAMAAKSGRLQGSLPSVMVSGNPEPSCQLQQLSRSTDAASAGHPDRMKISTIQLSRSITDGWAGQQCVRAKIPNPNLASVIHPNPTKQPSNIFLAKHHPADPDVMHPSQARQ
ncbi:hypothetical protein ACLOJK_034899 [Asimina triloba]